MFTVSSPLWGPAGVRRSLDDAAIVGLILQWRLLLTAVRCFLVQDVLQNVFALARRKVVEKILWRHLDEPEQEVVSVEKKLLFFKLNLTIQFFQLFMCSVFLSSFLFAF